MKRIMSCLLFFLVFSSYASNELNIGLQSVQTYSLSGSISGLKGNLLLVLNGKFGLFFVTGAKSFLFPQKLAAGVKYNLKILLAPPNQQCTVSPSAGIIGKKNLTSIKVVCKNTYTLGGTISGLSGKITLINQNGKLLTKSVNGAFKFADRVVQGKTYSVKVQSKPIAQTCTVSNGKGIMGGNNISNVAVNCSTKQFAIQGTINGLSSDGLILQNNGGNDLFLNAGTNTFAFTVNYAAGYDVTIAQQPPGQACSVTNGSGNNVTANITNVVITCDAIDYGISGIADDTVIPGLVLNNTSNGELLPINISGPFAFINRVPYLGGFNVVVAQQPNGRTCAVANGTGSLVQTDATNLQVSCKTNEYTIGGSVSGLSGGSLGLINTVTNETLNLNASSPFTFTTGVSYGGNYDVKITAQPSGQTCSIANGSGNNVQANVTNIAVICQTSEYTIGGNVSGLSGGSLGLTNTVTNETLNLNASSPFTFTTGVLNGGNYNVIITAQPSGQTCTIANGSGNNIQANVTDIAVTCQINQYTIGGTTSGLSGTGLHLMNNTNGEILPINANGSFTFPSQVSYGAGYDVITLTQPSGQTCVVANGTGSNVQANITDIGVFCQYNQYLLGGTVTGLASGTQLKLRNQVDNATVTILQSGPYTFSAAVSAGSNYNIVVQTQPTGQTCTLSNSIGTANSNVTNINATCTSTSASPCGPGNAGKTVSGSNACWLLVTGNLQAMKCSTACTSKGLTWFAPENSPSNTPSLAQNVCNAFGINGNNLNQSGPGALTWIGTNITAGNITCYWNNATNTDWNNPNGVVSNQVGSYFCPCSL